MQIQDNTVVQLDYTVSDTAGEVLDSSQGRDPLAYLHGHDNIVPGLEKALAGHNTGDKVEVTVAPEEAYGHRREELVQTVSRSAFQGVDELAPGMAFQAESDAGPMVVTVTDVAGDDVTVDGNHALAGKELAFSVTVQDVRAASDEEIEHGHVHDPEQPHE